MSLSVSLIIPGYNERARIGETIAEAHEYFERNGIEHEIIASVEGTDGSVELVEELSSKVSYLRVIKNSGRLGKGRAIRLAVEDAQYDVVGFTDADNKTPIDQFSKVGEAFAGGADVVIGSRQMVGTRIERYQPWYRRVGAKGFSVFMHAAVGLPDITDTQCGFKFFRRAAAKQLFRLQRIDGYMFDVEILCLAADLGYRIAQVPVRWRDDGDSRLALLFGNIRNVRDIIAIRRHMRARNR